jgi:hypothetical protein
MDTNTTPPGHLNDLERRLAEWRPSASGLEVDRLMFAAGRASARAGRGGRVWRLVSAGLALTAVALGIGLAHERAARLELAMQLRDSAPAVAPARDGERGPGESTPTSPTSPTSPTAPASYLAARRALTEDLDSWPVADHRAREGEPSRQRTVLTSHSPVTLIEP